MTFPVKIAKINLICAFLGVLFVMNGCSQANTTISTPDATVQTTREVTSTPSTTSVPVATATSVPCTRTSGNVVSESVPSEMLPKDISLKVYLPPCYDPKADVRYPVLYMLHGQTYLNDQWIRIGIASTADKLIAEKLILPMIIIMPQEDQSTADPYISKYGDAIVQEVIPWVDSHLATCSDRACRAIGGLSRGGNWAVRIGLSNPTLFAAIGAHSTPLFFGDLSKITNWVEQVASLDQVPVLYLDMGKSDENRANILQFEQELSQLGVVHDFYQFIGFHEEKYWSAHVEGYLRWYSVHLAPGVNNH
jgi:enterochelin esterase-like enzyme